MYNHNKIGTIYEIYSNLYTRIYYITNYQTDDNL